LLGFNWQGSNKRAGLDRMSEVGPVTVHVKCGDVEQTFAGSAEDVWVNMNKFFEEFIPSFEIARKLVLNVDLQKLARECEGIIGFAKEGPSLLVPRNKLTDYDTLALWLLANYVGHQLGMVRSEAVAREELQAKLGKSPKITSTRLGELVKNQLAARTLDEKYRITTLGIIQTQRDAIPKIKAKAFV
jgi:hypothetical protein